MIHSLIFLFSLFLFPIASPNWIDCFFPVTGGPEVYSLIRMSEMMSLQKLAGKRVKRCSYAAFPCQDGACTFLVPCLHCVLLSFYIKGCIYIPRKTKYKLSLIHNFTCLLYLILINTIYKHTAEFLLKDNRRTWTSINTRT